MTDDVVARVLASTRYRDVDRALLTRLAAEELPRSRNPEEAAKRVKRRLHQAVGAYRGRAATKAGAELSATWTGGWDEPMRDACRRALERHASTRERIAELDRFYPEVWEAVGSAPGSVLDLACGLNPLALPFMGLPASAEYLACDADRGVLQEVEAFLELVGQPHRTWPCDLVTGAPQASADVALLLKTVPLLDRQDRAAALRLVASLRTRHVVISFPARSLGGRGRLWRTYQARMKTLREDLGPQIVSSTEIGFRSELVYVLTKAPRG
ncbi:MAG: 16S rRNA methyltransferase [Chloroflexota bacterium]